MDATSSVAESFQHYFSVNYADTEEARDAAYRIRYRVYCEEFKYEAARDFPDGRERDAYDDISRHCLIVHKRSATPAACVRLVPGELGNPDRMLPFEKHCGSSLDRKFFDNLDAPPGTVCELSRLAVDTNFRRRAGESVSRFGQITHMDFSPEERRTLPLIAVAAYLAATAMTALTGRTNIFAMMEPFFPRLLSRAGLHFQRVGKDVDYRGTRAPYFITTEKMLSGMRDQLRELYHEINRALASAFDQKR